MERCDHWAPAFPSGILPLRRAAGLSQTELADAAPLSRREISNFERGFRSNARLLTIQRLADALEVNTSYLAAGGPVHAVKVIGVFDLRLDVGIAIDKLMRLRSASVSWVADASGIEVRHLRRVVSGVVDPSLHTLDAIGAVLYSDAGELIRGGELHAQGRREFGPMVKLWGDRVDIDTNRLL